MDGPVFSNELVLSLLDHIDEHKGATGLWKTDRKAAVASATASLNAKHTNITLTEQQVHRKVQGLCEPHHRKDSSQDSHLLLVAGRSALKEATLRALIDGPKGVDRTRPMIWKKRPFDAVDIEDSSNAEDVELVSTKGIHDGNLGKKPRIDHSEPAKRGSKRKRTDDLSDSDLTSLPNLDPSSSEYDRSQRSKRPRMESLERENELQNRPLPRDPYGLSYPPMTENKLSDRERHRLMAYRNAVTLLYFPYKHGPRPEEVRHLHRDMMRYIKDAVLKIWDEQIEKADEKSAPHGIWSQPNFDEVPKSEELWQLVRGMFDVTATKDVLTQLATKRVELYHFLIALVSAGMRDYVFFEQETDVSKQLEHQTMMSSMYQEIMSKAVPDIHVDIMRQTRQAVVNNLDISSMAHKCARKFHGVTLQLLEAHRIYTRGERGRQYLQKLECAFETAIKLHSQLLLLPEGCNAHMDYPRPGTVLNPEAMKASESPRDILKTEARIVYTLFPSVMWQQPPDMRDGERYEESAMKEGVAIMEDGWEMKTDFGQATGPHGETEMLRLMMEEREDEGSRPEREEVGDTTGEEEVGED